MPYDHIRDAEKFRAALEAISIKDNLSPGDLADLILEGQSAAKKLTMSRDSMRRFLIGQKIGMFRQLEILHDYLLTKPSWREIMISYGLGSYEGSLDLPAALTGFFSGTQTNQPRFNMDNVRSCIAGEYIMFRRDIDRSLPDGIRVSTINIIIEADRVSIQETQDYQHPKDNSRYHQVDVGYMFSYGRHVHFLMKQTAGGSVKLGVIHQSDQDFAAGMPVQYFYGYMFVASWRGVDPRTRIYCQRYDENVSNIKSGIIKLEDVPFWRASEYLAQDFSEGGLTAVAHG